MNKTPKPSPSNKSLTKKLAALPLGTSMQAVSQLFAERRQPLTRTDAGMVMDNGNLPVFIHFDNQDRLACIALDRRTSPKVKLAGVSVGMTVERVMGLYPAFKLASEHSSGRIKIEHFEVDLADNQRLSVAISENAVVAIRLEDRTAQYPDRNEWKPAPAGRYSHLNSTEGVAIDDGNFKLAILGDLVEEGLIDLGEPQELADHVYGRVVELDTIGYEFSTEIYDFLVRYPIEANKLRSLESLYVDATSRIYTYICPYWDGRGEEFDVKSLSGVNMLCNLRELYLNFGCYNVSLKPLSGLLKLEEIHTDLGVFLDYDALLSIPNLRYVGRLGARMPSDVRRELEARGVTVDDD